MGNSSGRLSTLTTIAPIKAQEAQAVRGYLWAMDAGAASGPLARFRRTHFARWVILDHLVYEGGDQQRDQLDTAYLLFTSVFDGDQDSYLAEMCAAMGDEVDAIWGRCVAFPAAGAKDAARFGAWMRRNQVNAALFYAAQPSAPLADVLESVALRKKLIEFATQAQGMDAAALAAAFQDRFGRRA